MIITLHMCPLLSSVLVVFEKHLTFFQFLVGVPVLFDCFLMVMGFTPAAWVLGSLSVYLA